MTEAERINDNMLCSWLGWHRPSRALVEARAKALQCMADEQAAREAAEALLKAGK